MNPQKPGSIVFRSSKRTHARRRSREEGFGLVVTLMAIIIIGFAIMNTSTAASLAELHALIARDRNDAEIAANLSLSRLRSDTEGGSVAPDAPVDGYSDVVVFDRARGTFLPPDRSTNPTGIFLRRQWRREAAAGGTYALRVSVTVMSPLTGEPRTGPRAITMTRSCTLPTTEN